MGVLIVHAKAQRKKRGAKRSSPERGSRRRGLWATSGPRGAWWRGTRREPRPKILPHRGRWPRSGRRGEAAASSQPTVPRAGGGHRQRSEWVHAETRRRGECALRREPGWTTARREPGDMLLRVPARTLRLRGDLGL